MVILEDLNIVGMMKNCCFFCVIFDFGWCSFWMILEVKVVMYGREFWMIFCWEFIF